MKILIIKTSSLGDIVQALPVADDLRRRFPGVAIDWVVEEPFKELVRCYPHVDRIIPVDTRLWRRNPFSLASWRALRSVRRQLRAQEYELVIDLQGNIKSALFTWMAKSKNKLGFGRRTVPESPNRWVTNYQVDPPAGQNIRDDYLHLVKEYFCDAKPVRAAPALLRVNEDEAQKVSSLLTDGTQILLCPGSAWKNKQLAPEALKQLLDNLVVDASVLVCWGSESERTLAQALRLRHPERVTVVDRLSLPALQHLMAGVDEVIAMDSLPLHLAGLTATPTFAVFGASSAAKYNPTGVQNVSMQGECPYGRTFPKRCPVLRTCPTGACIRNISADRLSDAIQLARQNR